jgi:hypothetical protein
MTGRGPIRMPKITRIQALAASRRGQINTYAALRCHICDTRNAPMQCDHLPSVCAEKKKSAERHCKDWDCQQPMLLMNWQFCLRCTSSGQTSLFFPNGQHANSANKLGRKTGSVPVLQPIGLVLCLHHAESTRQVLSCAAAGSTATAADGQKRAAAAWVAAISHRTSRVQRAGQVKHELAAWFAAG